MELVDTAKLSAGREVDALVAEKVMNLKGVIRRTGGEFEYLNATFPEVYLTVPHYSTDIDAAWDVAEKVGLFKDSRVLRQDGVGVQNGLTWTRTGWEWVVEQVLEPLDRNTIISRGESAALAICRAALRIASEEKV